MAELVLGQEAKQKLAILAAFLVACIGFVLFGVSISARNVPLLTALLALVGFVVVFPFPKLAIVIVILFAQIQYTFTGYYGTLISEPIFDVSFQWLDEVMLLSLLGNLVLTKLLRKKFLERTPALLLLALLFMVGVISARLNEVRALTSLVAQRYVFEMAILYLAITNIDLGERFLKGLVYFLLGIGIFQAVVGVLEFGAKYSLYVAGNHDIVQGTWGGGSANHIGIFFLCLSTIALARLRWGWRGPRAALFCTFVLLLVLTSCRTGIVLALPVILFVLREKMRNPKWCIAIATAFVFLAACLSFYYRNTEAEAGRDLGADEFVFQFSGRTQVIPVMAQVLSDNSVVPLLGAGPGTYLTATGYFYGSRMYLQVESMIRSEEVLTPFITASYAVIWMEYGMLGLVLFGMILLRFFLFAWKQEKIVESFFWKDYFRALQAIIAVYALVGGIFPLWTHFQVNIYLWLFPAIGVRYAILRRREAERAPQVVFGQEEEIPRGLPVPARLG